jgi:type 1 fimbria pilin
MVIPPVLMAWFISSSSAHAVALGRTSVGMTGVINDAACAIDTNSRDQTINMGVLPVSQVIRDGRLPGKPFSIRLIECRLERVDPNKPDWQKFQITFTGKAHGELFDMDGEARGIGMRILNSQGKVMMPGVASVPADIVPGEIVLNYTMDIMSNGEAMRSGAYRSTVHFKMDYY